MFLKKVLRWLPGLLISTAVSYFIFKLVDTDVLLQSIKQISILDMVIIGIVTLLSIVARAFVWMQLLPRVKFIDSFLIINESYLFNNIIPRSNPP